MCDSGEKQKNILQITNKKTLLWNRAFLCLILHIISRILFRLIGECGHLSCSAIARKITSADEAEYSGTSASSADSALHPGKDFAVSPPMSPLGLNYRHRMSIVVFFLSEKNVSVRTYWIAPYGHYPLPFISPTLLRRREFGLSSSPRKTWTRNRSM